MKAIYIKWGKNLPTEAPRDYPWEQVNAHALNKIQLVWRTQQAVR